MARLSADAELAEVAGELARSLRAGVPLPTALGDVRGGGRWTPQVRAAAALVARGVPVVEALAAWRDRAADPGVGLLVAACAFGHRHGGDPAAGLDGVAATLRDRAEVADETRALTAQARASVAVLVALPVLGAAGFSLLDPSVARVLLTSPVGWACLGAAAALDAAGWWASRRMVRAALR